MFKKKTEEETAADWRFIKARARLYVAALAGIASLVLWLAGYATGVFDASNGCTMFQSKCDKESK